MNSNDKAYCKKLVKDSLKIFRRDGYVTDIEELKEYILLFLSIEKPNKGYLLDYILELFLDSDKYQELKKNRVKLCKQCKRVLPESDFNKKGKNLRSNICKDCSINNTSEYRRNNRDKTREVNNAYYKRLKADEYRYSKYKESKQKFRDENKDSVSKSNRKYCLKKFLQKKLNREITKDEIERAFQYKDLNNIKKNIKVYEKFYLVGGDLNA